jgi:CRISPR-associated protein Csx10
MKQLVLAITSCSPIAIRADHGAEGATSAHYIPGTTLLGSLAAAHRILRPDPDKQEQFADFFLRERVFYPNLAPALFNESQLNFHGTNAPVLPLPRTALSCKRFSDFKPVRGERTLVKGHGIRDSLLDWGAFSLLSEKQPTVSSLLKPLEQLEQCSSCARPMDPVSGYYRSSIMPPVRRMKARVNTRLQTRTGINRRWGVVEESILYNREVFDEHMPFWGQVVLSEELVEDFIGFIHEASLEGLIRVGTGRTRGLGQVEIADPFEMERDDIDSFAARLHDFHTKMEERAKEAGMEKAHAFYFAITLHAPAILCDPFLRYLKTLDVDTLHRLLHEVAGINLDDENITMTPIYHSLGIQRISGWNDLWGTPRTHDFALETGSTFLFACSREPDDTFLLALNELEEMGIGRRRAEGFGRICISDPFHLQGVQA